MNYISHNSSTETKNLYFITKALKIIVSPAKQLWNIFSKVLNLITKLTRFDFFKELDF